MVNELIIILTKLTLGVRKTKTIAYAAGDRDSQLNGQTEGWADMAGRGERDIYTMLVFLTL